MPSPPASLRKAATSVNHGVKANFSHQGGSTREHTVDGVEPAASLNDDRIGGGGSASRRHYRRLAEQAEEVLHCTGCIVRARRLVFSRAPVSTLAVLLWILWHRINHVDAACTSELAHSESRRAS